MSPLCSADATLNASEGGCTNSFRNCAEQQNPRVKRHWEGCSPEGTKGTKAKISLRRWTRDLRHNLEEDSVHFTSHIFKEPHPHSFIWSQPQTKPRRNQTYIDGENSSTHDRSEWVGGSWKDYKRHYKRTQNKRRRQEWKPKRLTKEQKIINKWLNRFKEQHPNACTQTCIQMIGDKNPDSKRKNRTSK